MSCGSPHQTNCREVIDKVYLYLDGEIVDADRSNIRVHLEECAPCLRQYGLEHEVKALVARCCGSDTAPDGLRHRLLIRLAEVRVEINHVEFRAE